MNKYLITTDGPSYTLEAEKIIVTDSGTLIATVADRAVAMFAIGSWATVERIYDSGESIYLTEGTHAR